MSDAMGSLAATDEYDPFAAEKFVNPAVGPMIGSILSLPQRAIQNSQYSLDTGNYDPAVPVEAAMTVMGGSAVPRVPVGAGEVAVGAGPIRAYHGSPHDFNAFDMSKIGTGEGAQAYGHGLYFADSENVAKSYRDALGGTATIDGAPAGQVALQGYGAGAKVTPEQQIADYISSYGTLQTARYSMANKRPDLLPIFDELEKSGRLKAGGHMYEVNINADPAHFLDWDKPLSGEAAQKASEALKTAGIDKTLADYIVANKTGKDVYTTLANKKYDTRVMPSDAGAVPASDIMREAGIPGIKYLDQGSRGAGQGSSNYVVFNDKLIDIMRKYGIAGAAPVGMGALAAQDQYQPGGL